MGRRPAWYQKEDESVSRRRHIRDTRILTKVRATVLGTVHVVTTEAFCADPKAARAKVVITERLLNIIFLRGGRRREGVDGEREKG